MIRGYSLVSLAFAFSAALTSCHMLTPFQNNNGDENHKESDRISFPTAIDWLKESKKHEYLLYKYDNHVVDMNDIYYVNPLVVGVAVEWLRDSHFVEVSVNDAKMFNHHVVEKNGVKPYLVRGVFSNYNGTTRVFLIGSDLVVSNHSLGDVQELMFSPMIINLAYKPENIFLDVSSTM